jgi:hypothetical protein
MYNLGGDFVDGARKFGGKVKSSSSVSKNGLKNGRQESLREEKEKLQESRRNGGRIICKRKERSQTARTLARSLPAHHNSSNRRFVEFFFVYAREFVETFSEQSVNRLLVAHDRKKL